MFFKGAIFDMDGTLLDSMHIWENLGVDYLKTKGIKARPDIVGKLTSMTIGECAEYFINEYHVPHCAEIIIDEINKHIEDFYCNKVLLKPGVREFLSYLNQKGVSMCVATASSKKIAEAALKRCGVYNFFKKILSCDEYGSKTEGKIFNQALISIDAEKNETVVFEDAAHAVKTAKEAEFFVCGVYDIWERSTDFVKEISDVYITDFSQAQSIFTNY